MFAGSVTEENTRYYPAITWVAHTFVQDHPGMHYCKRSPDYNGDGGWTAPLATKDVGSWTAMDTIGSAGSYSIKRGRANAGMRASQCSESMAQVSK